MVVPTKGNLIILKNRLKLAKLGYEILDQKHNILVGEMMKKIGDVRLLHEQINTTFQLAYSALQEANITLGIITDIAKSIPIENSITISYRSIMGVELPVVSATFSQVTLSYGIAHTNTKFDYAYQMFVKTRDLIILLATVENQVYRLGNAIRKTKKRVNALKTVIIKDLEEDIKTISYVIEEREREEFVRQKVIKNRLV
jgi:V/A-type H+-transporting ATPase subunit D